MVSPSSSMMGNLRTIVKFLEDFLLFDKKRVLDREGAQYQMMGVLKFLARIGRYLVNFTSVTSETSVLELTEAREEIDRLRYLLEQEKATNAELVKNIDCSKKALLEAQEMIDC